MGAKLSPELPLKLCSQNCRLFPHMHLKTLSASTHYPIPKLLPTFLGIYYSSTTSQYQLLSESIQAAITKIP